MTMDRRDCFHYDLQVCTELQVLFKTASHSGLALSKSTKTITLQDVPLLNVKPGRPYITAEVTILVGEYPENYQK